MKKLILFISLIIGTNVNAFEAGISGGTVDKVQVAGAYIKKGKYSVDAHMGMDKKAKAMSMGIAREVLNFSDLGLKIGVGLSANKTEKTENNITTIRTYQGYDLELNYDVKKFRIRTIINSNGDIKAGIGFSF